jgi:hypothetical protein
MDAIEFDERLRTSDFLARTLLDIVDGLTRVAVAPVERLIEKGLLSEKEVIAHLTAEARTASAEEPRSLTTFALEAALRDVELFAASEQLRAARARRQKPPPEK